jgi:N-acetylglucosaminyldiphosphoundecaprenol N-acetyl-beta-D-mannosaminyltransferase
VGAYGPGTEVLMGASPRLLVGKVPVDRVTRGEALAIVADLVSRGEGGAVFTPNVDHVVLADENPRMRAAYARASLSLADGMPLLWVSRLSGDPLPEKISGSDFTPLVLEQAAERGWGVYFLGGAPGVAALARDKLKQSLPRLQVVGVEAPRIDPDSPPQAYAEIVARIRASGASLVFVALGAPKQELWIDSVREASRPAVFLAVGASLDFVAGTVARAPQWMSSVGLEWAFRLAKEPRRLWKRYLVRDPKFLLIVARSLAGGTRP